MTTIRGPIAEGYAARGWAVFPLKQDAKEPATKSGVYAGTDDLVTVRRWWSKTDWNIGIWTGASNLLVVDLDVDPTRGAAGISWWLEQCSRWDIDFDNQYMVVTPKGGLHVYFATDELYPPSVGRLAANVDIRASGSYVVAGGSVIYGREYEFSGADQPDELPSWLETMVTPQIPPPQSMKSTFREATGASFEQALAGLITVVQDAYEGERNNTLNWACWKVSRKLWDDDLKHAAWEALGDAGRELGLTDAEVKSTLRSAGYR